ncbi:coiled-coil domain-containing protein 169 [Pholidichthys leucotaenia]
MTKSSDHSKPDLSRLQAELDQEREMKERLEESVCDLQSTMCELQERLHSVDGEENEWKTRYETQVELNRQLERQISLVHEKLEDIRGSPVDRLASIRSYDDMTSETLRQHLKRLSEEKCDLQRKLMDCHLQIEQEGKAFHKTNDERRAYLSEIAKFSSTLEALRRQYFTQPLRAPVSNHFRGKQTSRKAEADSKKGKEAEDDGGGSCVKLGGGGGGGGGRNTERREGKKLQQWSKLPTLKDSLKHNS